MIDHVSVEVSDLAASGSFYDAVFAPLGFVRIAEWPARIGFGKRYPEFWINLRRECAGVGPDTGNHVCLRAPSREAVIAFHDAAITAGGRSDGTPADRQATVTTYFGAFVRDLDGNKIEAVTFPREAE